MKRILLIVLLQSLIVMQSPCQSFTVHDLISLSTLKSKDIGRFMKKSGFVYYDDNPGIDTLETSFISKIKAGLAYNSKRTSIDMYERHDSKYFILHVPSLSEYVDGGQSLIKSHFICDKDKDIGKEPSMFFQKANITIEATKELHDSVTWYSFKLREKKIPDSIMYAEDLLQFDSHEFLASYFGVNNVKKDLFYFSEKELKKCSVLFSGTRHQAVFVWNDENNLNNLSYILVSNILPTKGGSEHGVIDGNNEWKFQNGIHTGMPVRDILKLNETDFDIYGNKSDLAFMIKPGDHGKINFKKTAVMLRCGGCYDNAIFDQPEVSALDVAKANLPLCVFDIIIYP